MTENPTRYAEKVIERPQDDVEPAAAWGVWNVVAFLAGTAAVMHALNAVWPVEWPPQIAWLPGLYHAWAIGVWKGLFNWISEDIPVWIWDFGTLAYLIAMISVRATAAPHLEDHAWPLSGKITDYLLHLALWPLLALFYLLTMLHLVELVDHKRLEEVASTVLTFFISVAVGAVMWGVCLFL